MARSTVSTVIDRVRRQIAGNQRWPASTLDDAVDAVATTVALTILPSGLTVGSLIDVDVESMYVTAIDVEQRVLTVLRGWNGSTAAVHDAGTVAWINPRVAAIDIYDHLINEVASWPDSLFRVHTETITVAEEVPIVELPATFAGVVSVLDVRRQADDQDVTTWPRVGWLDLRGDATTWDDYTTTGVAIRLLPPLAAGRIYVTAKMAFDITDVAYDADLEDSGLDAGLVALAELGTKVACLYDAEISRSQRETVDATANRETVPPMAAAQAAKMLAEVYRVKRAEQIMRLRAMYPVRVK